VDLRVLNIDNRYRALNGLREWLCDHADEFTAESEVAITESNKHAKAGAEYL
jgi:hypothetical protein